jgi:hypothetical protein
MDRGRGLPAAIVLLGAFGLIIPFVGPLFNFGMGPDPAWVLTESRLLRHVIPGAAVIVGGGLMLTPSLAARRFGAILTVLGGGVLAAAPLIFGSEGALQFARRFVYHWGAGLTLVALAAFGLGRMSVGWQETREAQRDEPRTRRTVNA